MANQTGFWKGKGHEEELWKGKEVCSTDYKALVCRGPEPGTEQSSVTFYDFPNVKDLS